MQSTATTVDEYLQNLPADRIEAMTRLVKLIRKNIPKGFEERMSYGMIGYVIPHKLYPPGYHCDPSLPLPFLAIASQKNFIAVYHMGVYANPTLLEWFQKEYLKETGKKPDMGKSCIRFKKPELIPFDLIGKLATKYTVDEWVKVYEKNLKNK